jgi:Chitobiase/beta-hexosaminidase C-terminal domain
VIFRMTARGALLTALAMVMCGVHAQSAKQQQLGLAWDVRGTWQAAGAHTAMSTGSAVVPGSLLLPDPVASEHSITILLPDGQRILYECFTTENCARGFRVPALYRAPDAFATNMLARSRGALAGGNKEAKPARPSGVQQLPKEEAAGVLGAGNTIHIAGLASAMQNGHYKYDLRSLSEPGTIRNGLAFDKTSKSIEVVVPGPGLYDMTITDSLNMPRIDVLVAALSPAQQATVLKPFEEAHARLKDWNEDNQGWPIHDVQRAYLQSLMLGIKPQDAPPAPAAKTDRPGTAAEPRFSPQPGILKGDTEVTLKSDTSGAAIHYTVDNSQPFLSSPVLQAPIRAEKIGITIKAFASAPGMKDSAVVTGIFRFEE